MYSMYFLRIYSPSLYINTEHPLAKVHVSRRRGSKLTCVDGFFIQILTHLPNHATLLQPLPRI